MNRLPRRRVLGGSIALAAGVAAGTSGAQIPARAAESGAGELGRAMRVFLERGLFNGAWVTTPDTGRAAPTPAEWRASGFDTVTFYEEPYVNEPLLAALPPSTRWAIAVYPRDDGDGHLHRPPRAGETLLTSKAQRDKADQLFTVCFGDEEDYTEEVVDWLTAWFDLARRELPNVLVQNNQYAAQWSIEQLRRYARTAKPDLLTFDSYYFGSPDPYPGGNRADIYDALQVYRMMALEGHDGTGRTPIAFGHYTEGFKGGQGYTYVPSESELTFDYYVAWTMGARWTNLFRWERDASVFLLYKADGSLTPQFGTFARVAREARRLSPFLVRLHTKALGFVPGRHRDESGAIVANALPHRVPLEDPLPHPWLAGVESRAIGSADKAHADLPGDLLIGHFDRLPGASDALLAKGIPPDAARVLTGPDTKAFMVLNGLILPNTAGTTDSTDGSGASTRQRIGLRLERLGSPNRLYRVDRSTGRLQPVRLTRGTGSTDEAILELDGGEADLFLLETGPTYDQAPALDLAVQWSVVRPGESASLQARLGNPTTSQPMPDVRATVAAAPGWTLDPAEPVVVGDLAPGRSATERWSVGAPRTAVGGAYRVTVEASYRYGPKSRIRGGVRESVTLHVPFESWAAGLTNVGVTRDANRAAGDIDGDGNSYSAEALATAGIVPGATVTAGGMSFTWPSYADAEPDNVLAAGQAFALRARGSRLGFLGACTYGVGGGTGIVGYADGTRQEFTLSFPDWYGTPPPGVGVAASLDYRNTPGGPDGPVNVYVATVPLDAGKDIELLVLPNVGDVVSSGIVAMHLFATAIA